MPDHLASNGFQVTSFLGPLGPVRCLKTPELGPFSGPPPQQDGMHILDFCLESAGMRCNKHQEHFGPSFGLRHFAWASALSCDCPGHVPDLSLGQPNVRDFEWTLHFEGHEATLVL